MRGRCSRLAALVMLGRIAGPAAALRLPPSHVGVWAARCAPAPVPVACSASYLARRPTLSPPAASGVRTLVASSSSPRKSPRKNSVSVSIPVGGNTKKIERAPPPALLGSPPRHIMVTDDFLPDNHCASMRKTFDDRFCEPRSTLSERFVWDYWHVPDQYTLIRTPADQFFEASEYQAFCDALTSYGQQELGCNSITQPWLSYYIDGCEQRMHTDSWHGPFAYVFSLTNWEARKFSGGETFIMDSKVLDYWRRFDASKGLEESALLTSIPALMNRLTIFDPRLPHGVRPVRGTRDPREARLVIHGWFTDQGSPFYTGSISEADATEALNGALDPLYAEIAEECARATGLLNVRVVVDGATGAVSDVLAVADTLVPDPAELQGGVSAEDLRQEIMAVVHRHLVAIQFPVAPDGGSSQITIPFIFE